MDLTKEQVQQKAKEILNNEVLQIAFGEKTNYYINQMFSPNANGEKMLELKNKKKGMDEFIVQLKALSEPETDSDKVQQSNAREVKY